MSSEQASTRLPVIDVEPVLAGSSGAIEATAEQLREALENVGFLSIVGHGIEWQTIREMYDWTASYHELVDEAKFGHEMTSTLMGYVGLGGAQRGDRPFALNAAFFMGRPGSKRNQFPAEEALPGFRNAAENYYRTLERLCHQLLPLYAVAADMPPAFFETFFDPALATLRMSHYPPIDAEPDQWGIDPHSDAGFMTLLPANEVSGLSIESDDGWFAVDQEQESFVVNAGDTLRAWSNNRFRSTKHRALNKSEGNRYAIPFFFDPRPDTIIEALAGCIDEDRPLAVKPYRYGDYLQSFMRDGYIPAAN